MRGLFPSLPHSPHYAKHEGIFLYKTCCKSFYMSYLYRFHNPSFHCVQCHSKDFRLHHCLLLCKVRGKHFLLYLCSQNGSQAATLIKTFIKKITSTMRYFAHGECLSRRPCKDCYLRFFSTIHQRSFSSFYPSPVGEVRRGLVSR